MAGETVEDIYAQLLPGIQYAESRGQADPWSAVGDEGRSRGGYQIQPIMYEDIQQTYPEEWGSMSYEDMLAAPERQTAAALAGLRMLGTRYGLTDDALISGWNTGPTKARKGIINRDYVATVKRGLAEHRKRQAPRKGNPVMTRLTGGKTSARTQEPSDE